MTDAKVRTNNVPRDVIDAWQLTEDERKQFDYHDWAKIDAGEDSASFFRYRGQLYDLGNFMRFTSPSEWDGYEADSFFTATVVRYVEDNERVVVGRLLS